MLKTRFDLVDALQVTQTFIAIHFTKRSIHDDWLEQSRLDRFYATDCGFWIHDVHKLEHIQDQTLSDHDPIILMIQIAPENSASGPRKSSYFKVNFGILKREGTMDALRTA